MIDRESVANGRIDEKEKHIYNYIHTHVHVHA